MEWAADYIKTWTPSCKEGVALGTKIIYKDDEFVMETDDVSPTHVEKQRMIESALHLFQEITFHGGIEEMIEAIFVGLLKTANHEASKG